MSDTKPEVWLRGPVEGVPALLQPVAHALLQAQEELKRLKDQMPVESVPETEKPAVAPVIHIGSVGLRMIGFSE